MPRSLTAQVGGVLIHSSKCGGSESVTERVRAPRSSLERSLTGRHASLEFTALLLPIWFPTSPYTRATGGGDSCWVWLLTTRPPYSKMARVSPRAGDGAARAGSPTGIQYRQATLASIVTLLRLAEFDPSHRRP